jgi:4-hydroxy-2-oxoheptanedioate aldolase
MAVRNQLKVQLRDGAPAVGTAITMSATDSMELLARMNFDWLFIDTEHAPLNSEMLAQLLQVARLGKATPLVRVAWNDPVVIKKALDAGAMGVVVPWVNTREQAIMAVRAAKYPPLGTRGFGPRWLLLAGEDLPEYNRTANDEVLVVVQIETAEAMENLEGILTTPGVDAYMIGPADLANSLGFPGDFGNPAVERAIASICERASKLGIPGIYAPAPAEVCLRRLEQGFRAVCLGSDINFLRLGAQAALEKLGRPMYARD